MKIKKHIKEDWRYQHQDEYLSGLKFEKVKYDPGLNNDHDHCEFCFEKFSIEIPDVLKEGWTDGSRYRWICDNCFGDFEIELRLERKADT